MLHIYDIFKGKTLYHNSLKSQTSIRNRYLTELNSRIINTYKLIYYNYLPSLKRLRKSCAYHENALVMSSSLTHAFAFAHNKRQSSVVIY